MLLDFPFVFHPVVKLPQSYDVLDFTRMRSYPVSEPGTYSIGRYNEKRAGVYDFELFAGKRDNHIGIDIGGPTGTEVHAFFEGEIFLLGDNRNAGDYGPTVITRHVLGDVELYALHGHLSLSSLNRKVGDKIAKGEIIGWFGNEQENGGWPPHLHFQISLVPPLVPDMPGAVSDEDLEAALKVYPDPRSVLGAIY